MKKVSNVNDNVELRFRATIHCHVVVALSYLPLDKNFLVMTIPAELSPNQVNAYPACMAGVTLNSPTNSRPALAGKEGGTSCLSSAVFISTKRCG